MSLPQNTKIGERGDEPLRSSRESKNLQAGMLLYLVYACPQNRIVGSFSAHASFFVRASAKQALSSKIASQGAGGVTRTRKLVKKALESSCFLVNFS